MNPWKQTEQLIMNDNFKKEKIILLSYIIISKILKSDIISFSQWGILLKLLNSKLYPSGQEQVLDELFTIIFP